MRLHPYYDYIKIGTKCAYKLKETGEVGLFVFGTYGTMPDMFYFLDSIETALGCSLYSIRIKETIGLTEEQAFYLLMAKINNSFAAQGCELA